MPLVPLVPLGVPRTMGAVERELVATVYLPSFCGLMLRDRLVHVGVWMGSAGVVVDEAQFINGDLFGALGAAVTVSGEGSGWS